MDRINERILALWEKYAQYPEITNYYPLLYSNPVQHQIAFIGLNPSLSPPNLLSIKKTKKFFTTESQVIQFLQYLSFDPPDKVSQIQLFDEIAIKEYAPYFQHLYPIVKQVNLTLQHTDLYLLRETNSRVVLRLKKTYPQFFLDQEPILLDVLNRLQPCIIVVVNAKAADILSKLWKKQRILTEFLPEGYYSFTLRSGVQIPLHFAGNINYMDKYSRKRLIWHIMKSIRL